MYIFEISIKDGFWFPIWLIQGEKVFISKKNQCELSKKFKKASNLSCKTVFYKQVLNFHRPSKILCQNRGIPGFLYSSPKTWKVFRRTWRIQTTGSQNHWSIKYNKFFFSYSLEKNQGNLAWILWIFLYPVSTFHLCQSLLCTFCCTIVPVFRRATGAGEPGLLPQRLQHQGGRRRVLWVQRPLQSSSIQDSLATQRRSSYLLKAKISQYCNQGTRCQSVPASCWFLESSTNSSVERIFV